MLSITCWNKLGATFNPKGRRFVEPLSVLIINNFEHSSSNFICSYASDKSILENTLLHFSWENILSSKGNGYVRSLRQPLNPVEKSAHTRIFLFFVFTYTIGDAQSE